MYLIENARVTITKRESTQSIAVSSEEKELIEILSAAHGLKPATLSRKLLYRGLYDYLQDKQIEAPELDSEIFSSVCELIESDKRLSKAKEVISKGAGSKESKVVKSQRLSGEGKAADKAEKTGSSELVEELDALLPSLTQKDRAHIEKLLKSVTSDAKGLAAKGRKDNKAKGA